MPTKKRDHDEGTAGEHGHEADAPNPAFRRKRATKPKGQPVRRTSRRQRVRKPTAGGSYVQDGAGEWVLVRRTEDA